jgi:hypothetical protein
MRDADEDSFEVKAAQSRSLRHPAASAVDRLPAMPRTVSRRKRAASEKEAIVWSVECLRWKDFVL